MAAFVSLPTSLAFGFATSERPAFVKDLVVVSLLIRLEKYLVDSNP